MGMVGGESVGVENQEPEVVEDPGPTEEEEYRSSIEKLPMPFEVLKHGLSQLGRSPDGLKMVYLRLALPVSPCFLPTFLLLSNGC